MNKPPPTQPKTASSAAHACTSKYFHYQAENLYVEDIAVTDICKQYGTPCYIYSQAALINNWQTFSAPLATAKYKIFYAVKANPNLTLLKLLSELGAGFDTVSRGEIQRVIQATGTASNIVFSGVGKTAAELEFALAAGIYCFNVESSAELEALQNIANNLDLVAPVALRVNPNIQVQTHPYITTGLNESKFGIPYSQILAIYERAAQMDNVNLLGLACHIGSQITEVQPFQTALRQLLILANELRQQGYPLQHLNIGGGLGICYSNEHPPSAAQYINGLKEVLANISMEIVDNINNVNNSSSTIELHFEPGRSIVGNTGILVTKVEYLKQNKHKNFAIVDAGMNDFIRTMLYGAKHVIVPVTTTVQPVAARSTISVTTLMTDNEQFSEAKQLYFDIVGPICESTDVFATNQTLPLTAGDLLAITNTGAYGSSMSSNYNSRPRCAEILVAGNSAKLIRKRETIDNLYQDEVI